MFSLRIVNADFYIATPIPELDICHSTFRDHSARKVPVIRIYGATPSGQKTCLHVHGVLPYIYIPYDGTQPIEKYIKQFATSVDFAVQVALGKASSSVQHVYEISVVKGLPFYGYHEGERDFLKISLYNPFLVTRVTSLLQNGAVMNKVYQPHEAHIPYLLQFFIDYNLHGMNLLHASSARFRTPVRLTEGESGKAASNSTCPGSSPPKPFGTPTQFWNQETVPSHWLLRSDVERLSFCELEVDVLASDILNKQEIEVSIGANPGLAAIWQDEQLRRREANDSSRIAAPPSGERGLVTQTETEKKYKERIREVIAERDLLIQSQMGKLGRGELSPQELTSFQDAISSFVASQKDLPSVDPDVVSQFLSQHVEGSPPVQEAAVSLSQMVVDEDKPIVNQSIVQEVVEASQRSFSQDLSSSLDKEMVDILANLAEQSNPASNQKTPLSQDVALDQDAQRDEEVDGEELSVEEESLIMSQRVWDDIEPHPAESGEKLSPGEEERRAASQGFSERDLEGLSDTWTGSFLGGAIPQLDGAWDEESSDPVVNSTAGTQTQEASKKLGGARANTESVSTAFVMQNAREIAQDPEHFKGAAVRGHQLRRTASNNFDKIENTMDIWPQETRTAFVRSPLEEVHQGVSVVEESTEDQVNECLDDSFRLVLSESSDSDGASTSNPMSVSKDSEFVSSVCANTSQKSKAKQEQTASTVLRKKEGKGNHKSYTAVMTRFCLEKKSDKERRNDNDSEDGQRKKLKHASKQRQANLRERKVSWVESKPPSKDKRMETRRTSRRKDALMSQHAVLCSMADLKVPLKDVSSTAHLMPKFVEAKDRLRKRSESHVHEVIYGERGEMTDSSATKGKRSKRFTPVLWARKEKTVFPGTKISPKKKEEKARRYGALPIFVEKSPKKNQSGDTQVKVQNDDVCIEKRRYTEGDHLFSPASLGSDCGRKREQTGRDSSRNLSLKSAGDTKEGSNKRGGSSSVSGNKERSSSEMVHVSQSHQKEGIKRKLALDVDTGLQSTLSLMHGTRKKRKMSLQLSLNNPQSPPKRERVKSIKIKESGGSTPFQAGSKNSTTKTQDGRLVFNTEDKFKASSSLDDSEEELPSSERSLNDISCVPCSPIECEERNNSSPCVVPVETKKTFFSSLTTDSPTSSKSNLRQSSGSDENNSESSHKTLIFPQEKDTELLANALFNMSYPSPLRFERVDSSPPSPSSPLNDDGDCFDVLAPHSTFLDEENCAASINTESSPLPRSSVIQTSVQGTNFSKQGAHSTQGLSGLLKAPRLGETQTAIDGSLTKAGCSDNDKSTRADFVRVEGVGNVFEVGVGEEGCLHAEVASAADEGCSKVEHGITGERTESGSRLAKGKHTTSADSSGGWKSVRDTKPLAVKEQQEIEANREHDAKELFLMLASNLDNAFVGAKKKLVGRFEEWESMGESTERNDQPQSLFNQLPCGRRGGLISEVSLQKGADSCGACPMEVSPTSSTPDFAMRGDFYEGNHIVIEPLKRPPLSKDLLSTLKDHGLPQCRYKEPFCSNPDDIPGCTGEVGGRYLKIESNQWQNLMGLLCKRMNGVGPFRNSAYKSISKVSKLPEFESSTSLQGLKHWRVIMSTAHEHTFEEAANVEKNLKLQIALMGDGDIVITPCKSPPAPQAIKAWVRTKMARRRTRELQKQRNYVVPRDDRELQERNKSKTVKEVISKEVKAETIYIQSHQDNIEEASRKVCEPERTAENWPSCAQPVLRMCADREITAGIGFETRKEIEEKLLSGAASSVEVTSPDSLFSPGLEGTFTFPSDLQKQTEPRSLHHSLDEGDSNKRNNESVCGSGTQPINHKFHNMETFLGQQSEGLPEDKNVFTNLAIGPGNTTPTFEDQLRNISLPTILPLSPPLQTQGSPLSSRPPVSPTEVVYHSTPVATTSVYSIQSPVCTPISGAGRDKKPNVNNEQGNKKDVGKNTCAKQTPNLRRQLLGSQFKFVTPSSQPRHQMAWSSQIEGPSPNNTYGFKVSQINLKDTKALHEVQHLTVFSLEVHAKTRRGLRPDPEFDPIRAIFYYIQTDTPLPSGKNKVTGAICLDTDSARICASDAVTHENSISKAEENRTCSASTCTGNVSVLSGSHNTGVVVPRRPLLVRSGVLDCDVQYVAEEKDLFPALIDLIHQWDPDILVGYEVQLFSWGFLLERALTFEIDLCTQLSRVKGSSSESNMDAEKDRWGAAHTSEIKIAGRIILNVWRLMRHEVTLNSYTFESVAFHVLHERIPLYTFRTLSDWWDSRTALNRWRTVDHYVKRCRDNVRILESLDFIGRTSELARLFGILFFSVISRGSQYRVESMMLRIAKPMNYIAVSPSVDQRGAMRAPETIPLVMEPESRFYSDPVVVLDFQSLYPSMVIAYNYCFSTCLGRVSCLSEYGEFKFGATSLCVPPSLVKKLEDDIHISPNGIVFVKPNVRKGVLPSMLDEILQTRIMVKNSMKRWKGDKALGRMLDARQLGLKLIANVTFGYTSAHYSGRMPCVEIGDTIVRKARETLERAIELVNNTPRWGARVVYGDTDSLFVLLKGVTKEQAFSIGRDIVETVTAMNPKPVKLKFEKVYMPCVLQTKKRYVGYMYESLDQKEPVFDAKGIETVRRDGCPAVAKVLEKSLRILFETRDLSLVKKFVQRQCTKLMQGRASLQDFTFAKEYRGMKNYKPGACVPALELTRRFLREDRRSEPRVGERVPYVVVYGSPGLPLIQLVRRPQELLQDPSLRLNASYYITKQILPPLNRVFSLIGINVFMWYAELPRVVRVAPSDQGERKKGTISQYFVTMTCPVCQELSPTDLCSKCRAKPQLSAVTLANRVRSWERTYLHLAEICYNCCGSRETKLCCVSLDCPVFHKLVHAARDVNSSPHLRRILDSL